MTRFMCKVRREFRRYFHHFVATVYRFPAGVGLGCPRFAHLVLEQRLVTSFHRRLRA